MTEHQARIDRPSHAAPSGPAVHDPAPHPMLEPEVTVACPACHLPVGMRRGRLNRHVVGRVGGRDIVMPDSVRSSPLGPDGWCIAQTP